MTRRDLTHLLPALSLLAAATAAEADDTLPAHSRVFQFDQLPQHHTSGGAASRPIFHGTLPTGEHIELHETTLAPGQMPHPAHRHRHSELMLIREGTVEFILEGHTEPVSAGGVAYARSGEYHGLKNTSGSPATYFVLAIGTDS